VKYHIRNAVIAIIFTGIVLASAKRMPMPFAGNDLHSFSAEAELAASQSNPLYKEIQEKSSKLAEAPQDAYIDRVWKKTPGRNGVQVDIEKSYEKMRKAGTYDESLLVLKETPPAVQLGDLPPSPIYRGHPEKQMVSFLINVSWGTEYIPNILKALKEEHVKASFFIEGQWAKKHADYVKMIYEEGHLIGNHAYSHPDMKRLSSEAQRKQIAETNTILQAITGEKPAWFAPPSGSFNELTVKAAAGEDMQTILWTVDTIDWRNPSVSVMLNRVSGKLHPGATILMHPTKAVSDGMPAMIKDIKAKGYKLNTVERLMNEKRE